MDHQNHLHPLEDPDRPRGRRGNRPPGRGGPHPGRRSRRGGRARRGDVRAGVLALLAEEPQHGYQLMRQLDERSGGAWRPSPGSVYPTLAQLEDEGLVSSSEVDGRRIFTLTDDGRVEVDAHDGPAPWESVARGSDATLDPRGLVIAARQVQVIGDPKQIEAAQKVLADARRALYLILAGDEPEG